MKKLQGNRDLPLIRMQTWGYKTLQGSVELCKLMRQCAREGKQGKPKRNGQKGIKSVGGVLNGADNTLVRQSLCLITTVCPVFSLNPCFSISLWNLTLYPMCVYECYREEVLAAGGLSWVDLGLQSDWGRRCHWPGVLVTWAGGCQLPASVHPGNEPLEGTGVSDASEWLQWDCGSQPMCLRPAVGEAKCLCLPQTMPLTDTGEILF